MIIAVKVHETYTWPVSTSDKSIMFCRIPLNEYKSYPTKTDEFKVLV
jgi:hypothetical protein